MQKIDYSVILHEVAGLMKFPVKFSKAVALFQSSIIEEFLNLDSYVDMHQTSSEQRVVTKFRSQV